MLSIDKEGAAPQQTKVSVKECDTLSLRLDTITCHEHLYNSQKTPSQLSFALDLGLVFHHRKSAAFWSCRALPDLRSTMSACAFMSRFTSTLQLSSINSFIVGLRKGITT